jgi:lipopolysaccharide export system protein LptA
MSYSLWLAAGAWLAAAPFAAAQSLDLGNPPAGATPLPVQITSSGGIQWVQSAQTVTATGNAKAVRGQVTVTADELIAHYRKKAGAAGSPAPAAQSPTDAANALDQGGSEIYELDAIGHVNIYTATDNAYGDHAVYSLDADVLVLTGAHIKLTTPHDVITARDSVEYYSATRVAVARGNALIVADDGRTVAADTLVGYLDKGPQGNTPAPATPAKPGSDDMIQAGQLNKVDAIGHVVIHTTTDTATGDRGVYFPKTGRARLGGNVHIIRGQNELSGADALVNMKTGVATLLAQPGHQVAGTIVPNSPQLQGNGATPAKPAPKTAP